MNYSPFRHAGSILWKRSPLHLTFFVTRRCNARCSFCFYDSGKGHADAEGELSIDEVRKIAASMGNLLWLAFSGGEIFLRNDIVEITEIFYERNHPAIILFPTNGILTDVIRSRIEKILKRCRNSTIVVKLSLDGLEEVHDSIRGMKGSFRKTMETYDALTELLDLYPNFELGINTVYCAENQHSIEEVIEFVKKLDNIRTHTLSLIRRAGAVVDQESLNIEKYQSVVDQMADNLRSRESAIYRFRGARLKAAQDIIQRRLIYETAMKKRQLIPCYAGRLNIVLTETGDIYPCESFSRKLGNVRKDGYDLRKILRTDKAKKTIDSINSEKCFCTHECYFMTNILFNPRLYPALLKEYMKV